MRVLGVRYGFARINLAANPKRLEVCCGSAPGEVTKTISRIPEHLAQLSQHLALHHGRGTAAIDRVVVRVDHHGRHVCGHRHRMRRLQHLSRVLRVKIRKIVVEAVRELLKHGIDGRSVNLLRLVGVECSEAVFQGIH